MIPLPSKDYLDNCFTYRADTGELHWKERPLSHFKSAHAQYAWNCRNAGKKAGRLAVNGYWAVSINKVRLYSHRVIYKMAYDLEPELIDHKNRNASDNRLANLRDCDHSRNHANQPANSDNILGLKGVSRNKKRFSASIRCRGRRHHLGTFDTPEMAHAAYNSAAVRLFGEFAHWNSTED